jgi:hypothetical protein
MLVQAGRPLALASLALPDGGEVLDLDDPTVLVREELRPSAVATHRRSVTQRIAARLHGAHPSALAIRWWSTLDASWGNLTVFDRAAPALRVDGVRALAPDLPEVRAAADALGLL